MKRRKEQVVVTDLEICGAAANLSDQVVAMALSQ
jgi:hypothetical protein